MNANNLPFPSLKSSSFTISGMLQTGQQQPFINQILQQYERSQSPITQRTGINNSSGSKNNLLQVSSAANLLRGPNQQSYNAAKNFYQGSNQSLDKLEQLSNGYVGQEFLRARGSMVLDHKQSQFYEDKNDMNLNNLESDASSDESEDIRDEIKKAGSQARQKTQTKQAAKEQKTNQQDKKAEGQAVQTLSGRIETPFLEGLEQGQRPVLPLQFGYANQDVAQTGANAYGSMTNLLPLEQRNLDIGARGLNSNQFIGFTRIAMPQDGTALQMRARYGSLNISDQDGQTQTRIRPSISMDSLEQRQVAQSPVVFQPAGAAAKQSTVTINTTQEQSQKEKPDSVPKLSEPQTAQQAKPQPPKTKKRIRKPKGKAGEAKINESLTEAATSKKIKHRNQITKCPHTNGIYYASGMCKNCYHSKGRNKMATLCEHTDRKLYARGICKACYLRDYHNRTRQKAEASQVQVEKPSTDKGTNLDVCDGELAAQLQPLLEGSSQILNFIESHPDMTFEPSEQDRPLKASPC